VFDAEGKRNLERRFAAWSASRELLRHRRVRAAFRPRAPIRLSSPPERAADARTRLADGARLERIVLTGGGIVVTASDVTSARAAEALRDSEYIASSPTTSGADRL
jgi:hypothetical protein